MEKKDILKAIALGAIMAASAQGVSAATVITVSSTDSTDKAAEASTLIQSMNESGIPVLASRPECSIRAM